MKKEILSLILALTFCLGLIPAAFAAKPVESSRQDISDTSTASADTISASDPTTMDADSQKAYHVMIALQSKYPEGMPWTNNNSYKKYYFGCAAFARILSDTVYGDLPIKKLESFSYSDVKVGDVLRINDDTHSVAILEKYDDHVVLAEGNYNSSIHWGRTLTREQVMEGDYILTRVRGNEGSVSAGPAAPADDIPAKGIAYASPQTVTVDGKAMKFQMYALKDANGNLTNYIRLRDMAYVLNGTKAQFSVSYDGAVGVTTGAAYQASGGEMTAPFSGDRSYNGGPQIVEVNGTSVSMTAITLYDDNNGGYNYFKLRDLGRVLGFHVGYSGASGVFVESGKPYSE